MYRKLCNTRSDPFGSVHGVFSMTSASYNHRKPRVLYLAWLLELGLVICPFYFHIVYRLCSTPRMLFLRVHLKFPAAKNAFFIFLHLMFKIRQQLTKIKIDKFHGRFVITCGQVFFGLFLVLWGSINYTRFEILVLWHVYINELLI
jgi:hypothetical protein